MTEKIWEIKENREKKVVAVGQGQGSWCSEDAEEKGGEKTCLQNK